MFEFYFFKVLNKESENVFAFISSNFVKQISRAFISAIFGLNPIHFVLYISSSCVQIILYTKVKKKLITALYRNAVIFSLKLNATSESYKTGAINYENQRHIVFYMTKPFKKG